MTFTVDLTIETFKKSLFFSNFSQDFYATKFFQLNRRPVLKKINLAVWPKYPAKVINDTGASEIFHVQFFMTWNETKWPEMISISCPKPQLI